MEVDSTAALRAISVEWTVEAEDVVRAERISKPRLTLALRFGGPVVLALAAAASLLGAPAIVSVPGLFVGFGILFGYLVSYPEQIEKRVRALGGTPATLRAEEDGIHMDFAGSHGWREWKTMSKATETPSTVVVWCGRSPVFIIPKRAFAGPSDVETFMAYVAAHVPAPAAP